MGCDTHLKLKGFVPAEDLCRYLTKKYGKVKSNIERCNVCSVEKLDYKFVLNPGHEGDSMRYNDYGDIEFRFTAKDGKEELRSIFYYYSNINPFENLDYYKKIGLENMVLAETTSLILNAWGSSVDILTDIAKEFGGGWLDDNDCDDDPYYYVEGSVHELSSTPEKSLGKKMYVTSKVFEEEYHNQLVIVE